MVAAALLKILLKLSSKSLHCGCIFHGAGNCNLFGKIFMNTDLDQFSECTFIFIDLSPKREFDLATLTRLR